MADFSSLLVSSNLDENVLKEKVALLNQQSFILHTAFVGKGKLEVFCMDNNLEMVKNGLLHSGWELISSAKCDRNWISRAKCHKNGSDMNIMTSISNIKRGIRSIKAGYKLKEINNNDKVLLEINALASGFDNLASIVAFVNLNVNLIDLTFSCTTCSDYGTAEYYQRCIFVTNIEKNNAFKVMISFRINRGLDAYTLDENKKRLTMIFVDVIRFLFLIFVIGVKCFEWCQDSYKPKSQCGLCTYNPQKCSFKGEKTFLSSTIVKEDGKHWSLSTQYSIIKPKLLSRRTKVSNSTKRSRSNDFITCRIYLTYSYCTSSSILFFQVLVEATIYTFIYIWDLLFKIYNKLKYTYTLYYDITVDKDVHSNPGPLDSVSKNLKIFSINANYLVNKMDHFLSVFKKLIIKNKVFSVVFCIQEAALQSLAKQKLFRKKVDKALNKQYKVAFNCTNRYGGVVTLFPSQIKAVQVYPILPREFDNRVIIIKIQGIFIVNCYGFVSQNLVEKRKLREKNMIKLLNRIRKAIKNNWSKVVLIGDLNLKLRREDIKIWNNSTYLDEFANRFIDDNDLLDLDSINDNVVFTYFGKSNSRLDKVLIGKNLSTSEVLYLPELKLNSDHMMISVEIFCDIENQYLSLASIQDIYKRDIKSIVNWDVINNEIFQLHRNVSLENPSSCYNTKIKIINNLVDKYANSHKRYISQRICKNLLKLNRYIGRLLYYKHHLEYLNFEEMKSTVSNILGSKDMDMFRQGLRWKELIDVCLNKVRKRIKKWIKKRRLLGVNRWKKVYDTAIEEGDLEKLFNLVKGSRPYEKFLCVKVDGGISYDPEEVKSAAHSFFKDLYRKKEIDKVLLEKMVLKDEYFSVKDDQVEESKNIIKKIEKKEFLNVIRRLRTNTACGKEKIENLLLKKLEERNLLFILDYLNFCISNNKINENWRISNIFLIHKGGHNSDISNSRPIALLPSIYKIYSGIINHRLVKWMDIFKIIANEQVGFRKNLCSKVKILELIATIEDAILPKANQNELKLLFLDLKKAYDSVDHFALKRILLKHGLHKSVVDVLMNMVEHNKAFIITPYGLTHKVLLKQGIRQGDTISPSLFILFINPIINAIKKLKHKRVGYTFRNNSNVSIRIGAYADDLILYAKSESGLRKMFKLVNTLCNAMNLILNVGKNKTAVMCVGRNNRTFVVKYKRKLFEDDCQVTHILPVLGEKESYKYLGYEFLSDLNWDRQKNKILNKAIGILDKVKRSFLNVIQRANIINSLIGGLFRYHLVFISFWKYRKDPGDLWDVFCSKINKDYQKYIRAHSRFNTKAQFMNINDGGDSLMDLGLEVKIQCICDCIRIFSKLPKDSVIFQRIKDTELKRNYEHPMFTNICDNKFKKGLTLFDRVRIFCKEFGVELWDRKNLFSVKDHNLFYMSSYKSCCIKNNVNIIESLMNNEGKFDLSLIENLNGVGKYNAKILKEELKELKTIKDLRGKITSLEELDSKEYYDNYLDIDKIVSKIEKNLKDAMVEENIFIFTDGSDDSGIAGTGVVIMNDVREIWHKERFRCIDNQSVFRSEVLGIIRAIEILLKLNFEKIEKVFIVSDCKSALDIIKEFLNGSYINYKFRKNRFLLRKLQELVNKLTEKQQLTKVNIEFVWIKAHQQDDKRAEGITDMKVYGNWLADKEAKESLKLNKDCTVKKYSAINDLDEKFMLVKEDCSNHCAINFVNGKESKVLRKEYRRDKKKSFLEETNTGERIGNKLVGVRKNGFRRSLSRNVDAFVQKVRFDALPTYKNKKRWFPNSSFVDGCGLCAHLKCEGEDACKEEDTLLNRVNCSFFAEDRKEFLKNFEKKLHKLWKKEYDYLSNREIDLQKDSVMKEIRIRLNNNEDLFSGLILGISAFKKLKINDKVVSKIQKLVVKLGYKMWKKSNTIIADFLRSERRDRRREENENEQGSESDSVSDFGRSEEVVSSDDSLEEIEDDGGINMVKRQSRLSKREVKIRRKKILRKRKRRKRRKKKVIISDSDSDVELEEVEVKNIKKKRKGNSELKEEKKKKKKRKKEKRKIGSNLKDKGRQVKKQLRMEELERLNRIFNNLVEEHRKKVRFKGMDFSYS